MRGLLVLLGLIALAAVVLMSLGMLNVQMGNGSLPTVDFNVQGGRLPEIKAETGTIGIGSTNTTVEVPRIEMGNATVTLPTIEVKQAPQPTPAAQ